MKRQPKVPHHLQQSSLAPIWIPEYMVITRFNICLKTLRSWHERAGLPKYKIGRLILYKEDDLNELIENHKNLHRNINLKKIKSSMKKTTTSPKIINAGIVDDHLSATSAYTLLLNSMQGIRAVLEASSGEQLLDKLKTISDLPDILLMDVDMKPMNGIEITKKIAALYPTIKVIAFSAKDDDWSILQMVRAGACAYLSKEISSAQLKEAIYEVHLKGKYQADLSHLYSAELRSLGKDLEEVSFTDKEKKFLYLLCTGYTYAQMAEEMKVTIDSVDYYHGCISRKLNTKSLAIMVLQAIRMGIISPRDINKITLKK